MKIDGETFPKDDAWVRLPGMTLRQWYAGQVATGITKLSEKCKEAVMYADLRRSQGQDVPDDDDEYRYEFTMLAKGIFMLADALIAEDKRNAK